MYLCVLVGCYYLQRRLHSKYPARTGDWVVSSYCVCASKECRTVCTVRHTARAAERTASHHRLATGGTERNETHRKTGVLCVRTPSEAASRRLVSILLSGYVLCMLGVCRRGRERLSVWVHVVDFVCVCMCVCMCSRANRERELMCAGTVCAGTSRTLVEHTLYGEWWRRAQELPIENKNKPSIGEFFPIQDSRVWWRERRWKSAS